MTNESALAKLQQWFSGHCNGDWEHNWRVKIGSLDNPGWSLEVNLENSFEAPLTMSRFQIERTPDDWCSAWLDGQVFNGACGPMNLEELIGRFLEWVAQFE